jgi:hypothetical protein
VQRSISPRPQDPTPDPNIDPPPKNSQPETKITAPAIVVYVQVCQHQTVAQVSGHEGVSVVFLQTETGTGTGTGTVENHEEYQIQIRDSRALHYLA